jgi:hypothetical protein
MHTLSASGAGFQFFFFLNTGRDLCILKKKNTTSRSACLSFALRLRCWEGGSFLLPLALDLPGVQYRVECEWVVVANPTTSRACVEFSDSFFGAHIRSERAHRSQKHRQTTQKKKPTKLDY